MRNVYFLIFTALFLTFSGCNKFKSDHPQAGVNDIHATDLTAKSILKYADSIDKLATSLLKHTSLVYMLGDLSFYVEKYNHNGHTLLMTEYANNGDINGNEKKYYFRNDSLILQRIATKLVNDDGDLFKENRTFLRNNTVFKTENRTASAGGEIKSLPFLDVPLSQNNKSDKSFLENIKTLHEIINGSDKFDMVFENITTYPDARYIILKSKIPNSYRASILVKERDAFIDSLLNNPKDFKDLKLNVNWIVKDNEAIYVPVANNTSANGLNR